MYTGASPVWWMRGMARSRYGERMTRLWTGLLIAGIALAVAGVAAAAIGFAMDTTYPEEPPGWAFPLIWAGVLLAVVGGVGRAVVKNR